MDNDIPHLCRRFTVDTRKGVVAMVRARDFFMNRLVPATALPTEEETEHLSVYDWDAWVGTLAMRSSPAAAVTAAQGDTPDAALRDAMAWSDPIHDRAIGSWPTVLRAPLTTTPLGVRFSRRGRGFPKRNAAKEQHNRRRTNSVCTQTFLDN